MEYFETISSRAPEPQRASGALLCRPRANTARETAIDLGVRGVGAPEEDEAGPGSRGSGQGGPRTEQPIGPFVSAEEADEQHEASVAREAKPIAEVVAFARARRPEAIDIHRVAHLTQPVRRKRRRSIRGREPRAHAQIAVRRTVRPRGQAALHSRARGLVIAARLKRQHVRLPKEPAEQGDEYGFLRKSVEVDDVD